jgi:type II secretory pathway pseudopilin PulG
MRRRFHYRSKTQSTQRQHGYVLLVLMLMITLLAIAALVALPPLKFRMERDREEELIHRGVQYSRAIRKYFKKFGRYPTKLEDLDSSNNTRFLRKHYKDPVTGKDFKLLHYGDPGVIMGGATGLLGGQNAGLAGATGLQGNPIGGTTQPFGGGQPGPQLGGSGGQQGFGGVGGGQQPLPSPTDNSTPPGQTGGGTGGAYTGNAPTATTAGGQTDSSTGSSTPGPGSSSTGSNGPTIGGGPIVGVVSTSKKSSIREFNHKKEYDNWQFIYDPSSDRGGLLMTPNQPPLQGAVNLNGQPANGQGAVNPNGSPMGTTGLGNNPPQQNNSNPGPETTPPPSNPPQ